MTVTSKPKKRRRQTKTRGDLYKKLNCISPISRPSKGPEKCYEHFKVAIEFISEAMPGFLDQRCR
jgi:hypothetical protein